MLLGLEDFDVDLFMTFDDTKIRIYYSDFETIPELADILPLGSFDDETGSILYVAIDYEARLEVAKLFMKRDGYILEDIDTKALSVNVKRFDEEFYNIPEVSNFFAKYKELCARWGEVDENTGLSTVPCPPEWKDWHDDWCETTDPNNTPNNPDDDNHYIDWNTYPNWCQKCIVGYDYDKYGMDKPKNYKCAHEIPLEVIPPQDFYFMGVVYFNGIYRTNPENAQSFGLYQILTDIDFEINKFSMIVDIKRFFTLEFINFLKIVPGDIPFAADFGTHIKYAIQTKNTEIQKIEVQNELDFFVFNFNTVYGDLVHIENIKIQSNLSDIGADSWTVEVYAKIKAERLIYRIEL
jgi:hypothetical protein